MTTLHLPGLGPALLGPGLLGPGLLGHSGQPPEPHDAWTAFTFDPLALAVLGAVIILYRRGRRADHEDRGRHYAFVAGIATVAIALISPIAAIGEALLSVHMLQHVLLMSIAAPLLALAAPSAALQRGLPVWARRGLAQGRHRAHIGAATLHHLRHPGARWIIGTAALWIWHARPLYGAAVDHVWLHRLEHGFFFGTSLLVWSVVLGPSRTKIPIWIGLPTIFTFGLQSSILAALMTFSNQPWYAPYATPAPGWGLDPLTDQQLAGLLMWLPVGMIHTAFAIVMMVRYLERPTPGPGVASSAVGAQGWERSEAASG